MENFAPQSKGLATVLSQGAKRVFASLEKATKN